MNKVILTKEQAKAMEELKSEHLTGEVVKTHLNDRWSLGLESLNDLTVDEFAQAYYSEDGYEVEPEFKVGDWVTDIHPEDNVTGVITKIDTDPYGNKTAWGYYSYDDIETNLGFEEIRHATPSEIAKEKERRFFAEHGREPWELKKNDILNDRRENCTVTIAKVIDKEVMTVLFTNGDWEFHNNIVEDSDWRVACFADKRLDVKNK